MVEANKFFFRSQATKVRVSFSVSGSSKLILSSVLHFLSCERAVVYVDQVDWVSEKFAVKERREASSSGMSSLM